MAIWWIWIAGVLAALVLVAAAVSYVFSVILRD
jgi:hypothetical protein